MTISVFTPSFLREAFAAGADPVVFPGAQFGDGQHRLLVGSPTGRALYKTADFVTFTTVSANWLPSEALGGANTFQDAVVLSDGTFALYQNDGTENTTAVWTGTAADIDAGTITRLGRVLSGGGDCGAFYDAGAELIHIFTEDPASPYGSVSSTRLLHFTTTEADLLTPTQHGDAVFTGGGWGTGDPDIIEHNGEFYMFADYTIGHPNYWIALYHSTDLHTWTLVKERLTATDGTRGGDFDLVLNGDHYIAFTEYSGPDLAGIGVWRLDVDLAALVPSRVTVGGASAVVTVGGVEGHATAPQGTY